MEGQTVGAHELGKEFVDSGQGTWGPPLRPAAGGDPDARLEEAIASDDGRGIISRAHDPRQDKLL